VQPGTIVTSDTRIYEDDIAVAVSETSDITWFISTAVRDGSTIMFHVTDDVIARSAAFGSAHTFIPPMPA
jgi:hypothetical protein